MIEADEADATGEELAQEQRNVAEAKWLIDHHGKVLPVTNLFDREGERTDSAVLAYAAVAFDADAPGGKWCCISQLGPGDIWRKIDGEVPRQDRARCH